MSPKPTRFDIEAVAVELTSKLERFVAALPLLLIAISVVWLAWMVGGWLSRRDFLNRARRHNPFLQDLLRSTARWAVVLVGIVIALEVLGATKLVGAVLGTAGVLGVALGFAFKDILENYLAGLLMSLRQPFSPKDHVVIDGNEGVVTALTSRATILMTLQGNHLRLPNALVFRSVILNYTRNPLRRLEFDVGVGTQEDLLRTQRIGVESLRQVPGIVQKPPPRAQVVDLAESTVTVRFMGWVDQRAHEFLLVRGEAIRQVKETLDENGVDLPNPIYELRFGGKAAATEPMKASGFDKAPEPAPDRASQTSPLDTRKTTDLQEQIDADPRKGCSEDLLHEDSPQE